MTTGHRWQVVLLVSLMLVGLALSACGSAGNASSAASTNDVLNLIIGGNHLSVGVTEVNNADYLLTAKCMSSKGFTMPPLPSSPPRWQVDVSPVLNGGEVASAPSESAALQVAKELGYGIALRREEAPHDIGRGKVVTSRSGAQSYHPSTSEVAYQRAYVGPKGQNGRFTVAGIAQHKYPTEGCAAEAYKTLYGSTLLAVETGYLPEDLNLAVTHEAYADPSFIAATNRWSACLARATGHQASEPYNVPNELLASETKGSGPVTPAERAYEVKIALADARCQYSSGFIQTSVALRRKYAAHLSGPYEGLLLTIVEARAQASRKAQAVLAAAGR